MNNWRFLWAMCIIIAASLAFSCAGDPKSEGDDDDNDDATKDAGETDDDDNDDDNNDDDNNDDNDDNDDDDIAPPDDDDDNDDDDNGDPVQSCVDWKEAVCKCFGDTSTQCQNFKAAAIDSYNGDDLAGYCAEELAKFECPHSGDDDDDLGECPEGLRCADIQGNLICVDQNGMPGQTEACDQNNQCPSEKSPIVLGSNCVCVVPCKTVQEDCIDKAGNRKLGEQCKCDKDCSEDAPYCGKNLTDIQGSKYCTTVDCKNDGECDDGFACLKVPDQLKGQVGHDAFCEQCATKTRYSIAEGGTCKCDVDCKENHACISGKCQLLCDSANLSCPTGYECREKGAIESQMVCEKCLVQGDATKLGYEAECKCNADCALYKDSEDKEYETKCHEGMCVIVDCQKAPDTCPKGLMCKDPLLGGPKYCITANCGPNPGTAKIGEVCECDVDCHEEAPTCINDSIMGYKINMCTLENCEVGNDKACPEPARFKCCDLSSFLQGKPPLCVDRSTPGLQYICP